MTRVQIVYWRDIPAQVKARQGSQRAARPLSGRFQQAIDEAAMRAGLSGTDDYLGQWRSTEGEERPGDPETLAQAAAEELEAAYPQSRLAALAARGGAEE
ncbi:MAG TPA: virulence factor [Anaerolineales bacterium]|nr:virulence factor [Anaerolineales bacterium]